jgi:hypothetical protein
VKIPPSVKSEHRKRSDRLQCAYKRSEMTCRATDAHIVRVDRTVDSEGRTPRCISFAT